MRGWWGFGMRARRRSCPGETRAVLRVEGDDLLIHGVTRAYIVPSKGLEHWKDPKKAKQLIDDINAWLKPKVRVYAFTDIDSASADKVRRCLQVAHYKQLTGGIVFTDELPRL